MSEETFWKLGLLKLHKLTKVFYGPASRHSTSTHSCSRARKSRDTTATHCRMWVLELVMTVQQSSPFTSPIQERCSQCRRDTSFLGRTIDKEGISVDPENCCYSSHGSTYQRDRVVLISWNGEPTRQILCLNLQAVSTPRRLAQY